MNHTFRFGGAIHRIAQGDFYAPGNYGPSVTSSNGLDVITAIDSNPNLLPLYANDPRGAADNPLNYPVGTVTIFNGLGNFSEHSAFNRPGGGHFDTRLEGYVGDTFNLLPNVNVSVGVNYVRDSGRTDSDLAPLPCSAINLAIVQNSTVHHRLDSRSIRSDPEQCFGCAPVPRQEREPARLEFRAASRSGVGSGTQWADGGARERRNVL